MIKKAIILLILFTSIQLFYNCSGVSTKEINTIVENKVWNENDSEVIVDSIVNKMLLSQWQQNFTTKRKPKLVVGSIENLTIEKIDTDLLSKNIERNLINSGDITFITSKDDREVIRNDRRNKNDFDGEKEFIKYLKPLKSDFFISGDIKLNIDSVSVPTSKEYKLTLEILNSKNLESVSIMSEILMK